MPFRTEMRYYWCPPSPAVFCKTLPPGIALFPLAEDALLPVVAQFNCHPEQAAFAQRRI